MMKYATIELINEWDALNATTIPSMNKALINMVLAARQILRYKRLTLAAVIFQTAEYHVMNTFIRTKTVTK